MMLSPVPSLTTLPAAINSIGTISSIGTNAYVNPAALTGTPLTAGALGQNQAAALLAASQVGMLGGGAGALSTPFEGVPIFLVPAGGTPAISLSLLKAQQQAREMKVNWATQPGTAARVDTSKHFHVFVGDLSLEVDNKALHEAFGPFGEISDAKVIRDLQTLKSKGYGFVSFVSKADAERAIEGMNGQWLGRRTIRTNWATRKPLGPGGKTMSFDDVYNQTHAGNASVYVGGLNEGCTEEDVRKVFAKYGTIVDIRVFKQQGYSFVKYDNKESATHAIVNLNGAEVNGATVRTSWGRSGHEALGVPGGGSYGYGYGMGAGMGPAANAANAYWNQYYQQYYQQAAGSTMNPAVAMQQWQNYYQAGGQ